MTTHTSGRTVRRSVALPSDLAEEALQLARTEGSTTFNGLVRKLLERYVEERRAAAFAASMSRMARDPAIQAESRAITAHFLAAENDGLKDEP